MPEISRFRGVVVYMNYSEHGPPHFHVRYGDVEGSVAIRSREDLGKSLPPRVLRIVREWAGLHEVALMEDWHLAREKKPLRRIPPLA